MAERLATIGTVPGGADYTSLSACEAIEQYDFDTNNDYGVWRYTEAIDDTTEAVIDGSTTSVTDYIKIEVAAAVRHEGVWSTSKQRLRDNANRCMTISDNHVIVEGLQIEQYGTGNSDEGIRITTGVTGVEIRNCIVRATTGSTDQDGIYAGNYSVSVTVENCIVYGFYRGGIHAQNYNGGNTQTWNIRNCTVWNNGGDGDVSEGNVVSRTGNASAVNNMNVDNTIAMNSGGTSGDFDEYNSNGTINWSGDYNINSDGTGATLGLANHRGSRTATASTSPGTGDWVIFTNITSGSEDFHLQSDAENDAEGYGADLSVSAGFDDDIDFETRSDWDAGADEIVSATTDNLTANDIDAQAASFSAATIGQGHALTANDLDALAASFSSATIGQVHIFTANDLDALASTLGSPTLGLTHVLDATGLSAQAGALGTPTIGQGHALTASDLDALAASISATTLGQIHLLTASDLDALAASLGTPTLAGGTHNLTADDFDALAATIGTPTIGQEHALDADDVAAIAVLGSPFLDLSAAQVVTQHAQRVAVIFML